jgi:hypothetical protein
VLDDGRPAFLVMRAVRPDVFSAQRLAALRTVLKTLADEPQKSLGALLTRASRGVRSGWVEGLSGSVACALVALADEAAEVAVTSEMCALLVRAGGDTENLATDAPPVGERSDHSYESKSMALGSRDKLILLSHAPESFARLVASVVTEGYTSSSRDALNKLFGRLGEGGGRGGADLTGAVVTRARSS